MMCVRPIIVKVKGLGMQVPCGRCIACRVSRTREWAVRLTHELEECPDASFITLTYKDLPANASISKREVQLFFKRLRKSLPEKKLRYYACGEYGGRFGRPHYHAILYGLSPDQKTRALVKETWGLGLVHVGSVTYDSCRYVAQYIQKKIVGREAENEYGDREAPFALMSKKIGQKYALKRADQIRKNLCVKKNGKPAGLPRYYRKILNITTADLMGKAIERQEAAATFISKRTIKRVSDPLNLVDAVYNIDIDTSNQSGITKNEYIFAQRRQIENNLNARFSLTDQRKRDIIK